MASSGGNDGSSGNWQAKIRASQELSLSLLDKPRARVVLVCCRKQNAIAVTWATERLLI